MNYEIVFGSMRMLEKNRTIAYWIEMFEFMYDLGITEHHVSIEYESYNFYLEVLKVFQSNNPTKTLSHICKLAEPSFNSIEFSKERLQSKCLKYSEDLNSRNLCIQWMSRFNINDLESRLTHLGDFCENLNKEIFELKEKRIINEFLVFPYSLLELDVYHDQKLLSHSDGYIVYCNLNEKKYGERLKNFSSRNNTAIRPFHGKKSIENYTINDNLDFIVGLNSFNRIITSFSNKNQVNEVLRKIH